MARNLYTENEIAIIKEFYETESPDRIMEMLPGRNWSNVRHFAAKRLRLLRRSPVTDKRTWTDHEDEQIKKMITTHSSQEIAQFFNVSLNIIQKKIKQLGVLNCQNDNWTPDENLILYSHYRNAPCDYIKELLPNRTWSAIRQQASKVLNIERNANDTLYCNYTLFDHWTEKSAYILGFTLADGYVSLRDQGGSSNQFAIQVDVKDIDIVYKIAAALKYRGTILYRIRERNNRRQKTLEHDVGLCLSNKWLISQLINKGIPAKDKSYTATFPSEIPQDMLRHFVRGLIDGDGWISYKLRKITKNFSSLIVGLCGTKNLVEGVFKVLPITSDAQIRHIRSQTYAWSIEGERAFQICEWLYKDATIFLDRKYEAYCQAKEKYAPSLEQSSEDTQ